MIIKIPVSPGELIDKITILELKASHIKDSAKLPQVIRELSLLDISYKGLVKKYINVKKEVSKLKQSLYNINKKLWKIEDRIRKHENESTFDAAFIELARSVYLQNDKRSALKNKINSLLGSKVNEVKQYTKYR